MTISRASPKPALTHASFENSYRLAFEKTAAKGVGYAVVETGDPERPFIVALSDDGDPKQIVRFKGG